MDYEKKVPEWHAEGTEPPESLKQSGFEAGYKPPAAYFNWFWNRVSACLTEIRSKLSEHAANKENPHGVTAAQVGLDKVNNTPDTEKNVAFASESALSRKVENNLVLRFNGGGVENTNLFTYNGSGGKSVNITPDKINAAKKDLSNVDEDAFKAKASDSGVGIPIAAATSADGIAYTATVEGVTELYNGLIITIVPDINSASTAPTLDVNGIGAKMVRLPLSFNNAAMSTPKMTTYISAGRPLTLQYDAAYLNNDGIWKVFGKQRTSAQDLYGTVPIEGGGTDATTAEAARANLDVPSNAEMRQRDRVVNLLDNSDFTNPVNQRGLTTYTSKGYTIDRWEQVAGNNNVHVDVSSDGLTLTSSTDTQCWLYQVMEHALSEGDKVTAYVELSDGTVDVKAKALSSTQSFAQGTGYVIAFALKSLGLVVQPNNASVTIKRVALYKGVYTADTIPTYQPKGYAHELAECQRCYRILLTPSIPFSNNAAGTAIKGFCDFSMRVNPTVRFQSCHAFFGNGTHAQITSMTANQQRGTIALDCELASSIEANQTGAIGGLFIELSADYS